MKTKKMPSFKSGKGMSPSFGKKKKGKRNTAQAGRAPYLGRG